MRKEQNLPNRKKLFLILITILFNQIMFPQSNLKILNLKITRFYKNYVVNNKVNYSEILLNKSESDNLVQKLTELNRESFTANEEKAFWINLYNLFTIQSIVQHYPVKSPLDINGMFNGIKHRVSNEDLTLNEIEKDKLINKFYDPRIHFAIVCGAASCPQIIDHAYEAIGLDKQLDERAKYIVNNPEHVKVDYATKTIYLNEIFKWYENDFVRSGESILGFINQYRNKKIPTGFTSEYRKYNWELNDYENSERLNVHSSSLQAYTPSTLFNKGEYELKIFNNLYTQAAFFNDKNEKIELSNRSTFFTSSVSFLYGYSNKLNIGLELWVKSVRNDVPGSSPFSLFQFESNSLSRTVLSHVGPKIKFAPFDHGLLSKTSIQSTFLIPIAEDLEGANSSPFVAYDSFIFLNQFFYDTRISNKVSFFSEIAAWYRIDRNLNGKSNRLEVPAKFFVSWYPTDMLTLYVSNEFAYQWQGSLTGYYLQGGVGLKYQLFPFLELETLLTDFYFGQNSGAGSTANFGFRIIN